MLRKILLIAACVVVSGSVSGAEYAVARAHVERERLVCVECEDGTKKVALVGEHELLDINKLQERLRKEVFLLRQILEDFFRTPAATVTTLYVFDKTTADQLAKGLMKLSNDATVIFCGERIKVIYDCELSIRDFNLFKNSLPEGVVALTSPLYELFIVGGFYNKISPEAKTAIESRIENAVRGDFGSCKYVTVYTGKNKGGSLPELTFHGHLAQVRVYYIEYKEFLCFLYAVDCKTDQSEDIGRAAELVSDARKDIDALLEERERISAEPVGKKKKA